MGNGGSSKIIGRGTVHLETSTGCRLMLKDVRHVEDIRLSLISVGLLDDENYANKFCDGKWKLSRGNLIVARGKKQNSLYVMQANVCSGDANVAGDASSELWHKRLGHMSEKGLRILSRKDYLPDISAADILLWREKKVTAGVLGFATVIWVLFELLEYHLLTLVCHILIVAIAVLFLWSNASAFINAAPPQVPEVILPKDIFLGVASALRIEINRALKILRDIASGKDLKRFLVVIVGLWVVSILGNIWNFLTLSYIVFVLLHTVPVLYEKNEDKVDALAEKAEVEIKKHYAVFDANVVSKIPRFPLKGKKLE